MNARKRKHGVSGTSCSQWEQKPYGRESGGMQLPLPALDLPNSQNFSEMREEDGKLAESLGTSDTTLENTPSAPVQCKSARKNFGQEPRRFRDQLNV